MAEDSGGGVISYVRIRTVVLLWCNYSGPGVLGFIFHRALQNQTLKFLQARVWVVSSTEVYGSVEMLIASSTALVNQYASTLLRSNLWISEFITNQNR